MEACDCEAVNICNEAATIVCQDIVDSRCGKSDYSASHVLFIVHEKRFSADEGVAAPSAIRTA